MMNAQHDRSDRPKVYELAEQLGRRPKELVDAARSLGLPVQNRLTRLTPESVSRLRAHFATPQEAPPLADERSEDEAQ